MKKIAIVLPVLPHYRIELLESIQNSLQEENIELTVITGTNASKKSVKEFNNPSFKLVKNKTRGVTITKLEIQWQSGLIRAVSKLSPDKVVVLYHAGKLNHNLLLLYLQFKRIPYILWGSGSGDRRTDLSALQRRLKSLFKKIFINKSSAYLSYSTLFRDQLINNNYPEKDIFVAQNTINVERIISENKSFEPVQANKQKLRFLFVGVIFKNKRLDTALEAFARLSNAGYSFQFDIVGSGESLNSLKKQAEQLDLAGRVVFHGAQYGKKLASFFVNTSVFLLPGTGGLAINEAMAYGIPVITTPGDGTAYDLVENETNGFILEFDYNVSELENRLKYMLEQSPNKLQQMGQNSLRIIQERATLGNMVNQIINSINHA